MKDGHESAVNVDRLRPSYKLQELQPHIIVPKQGPTQLWGVRDDLPALGFASRRQALRYEPQQRQVRREEPQLQPHQRRVTPVAMSEPSRVASQVPSSRSSGATGRASLSPQALSRSGSYRQASLSPIPTGVPSASPSRHSRSSSLGMPVVARPVPATPVFRTTSGRVVRPPDRFF